MLMFCNDLSDTVQTIFSDNCLPPKTTIKAIKVEFFKLFNWGLLVSIHSKFIFTNSNDDNNGTWFLKDERLRLSGTQEFTIWIEPRIIEPRPRIET